MENNSPPGWVITRIENIVSNDKYSIVDGPFGSQLKRSDYVDEGIPLVRILNIGDSFNFDETHLIKITQEKFNQVKRSQINPGDILFSKAGTIGRVCFVPDSLKIGAITSSCAKIKIHESLSSKFFLFQLSSTDVYNYLISIATGSTRLNLNLTSIKSIPVNVPPLAEQHRIVSKLDAIMQKVESNKQRLEKIPNLLKRFRQSILAAAVSGKLTEDWREKNPNIESAEELLIRLEDERPNNKNRKLADIQNTNESDLPETWKWCQLDEIALLVTDGKHGDCSDKLNSGYYFLSAKDISNGVLNYKNARQIVYEEFLETHRRTNLEEGDICVVNTGATVGKSAIAQKHELTPKTTFQKSVAVIKLFKESIDSKYINYIIQLETPKILKKSGGSAINNWLLSEMRAFWCQLPPTKEQKEIVRRVEQLFAFADKLEVRYNKAKSMIDKLPQSVLAKAFRGELVPQDPNDQPATMLLERIKAEKEKFADKRKLRKKT